MLVDAKTSIWHNINANITKLWASIQIIFEQEELVQKVKATIEQTTMEVKRVLKKRNLMIQLENKCKELKLQVKRFNIKFNVLQEKGLPALRASNRKLIPLENYQDQLCNIVVDASIFAKVRGTISGKAFMEGLHHDLFIQHQIHHLFLNKPTFQTYTKLDERFQILVNFSIPCEERWDKLLELVE